MMSKSWKSTTEIYASRDQFKSKHMVFSLQLLNKKSQKCSTPAIPGLNLIKLLGAYLGT